MKLAILSNKMRLKKPIGNIHFGKIILTLILVFTMLLGNITSVIATDNTKTMTVTIGEGTLDQSSLSRVVIIPNLKSAKNKSVNNGGNATLSISGNNVTVNASGGTPTRTVNNPQKYNKVVTDFKTRNANDFATTIAYSLDGYTANLAKNGVSRVTSGEFTPGYSEEVSEVVELGTWSGGYQHYADQEISSQENRIPRIYQQLWKTYPESYVTVVWGKRTYINTVPDRDTRVWRQDYIGTAYKAGVDNYYSYDVVIEYIDNSNPILEISLPGENSYFGKNKTINLSGTVNDPDSSQNITISATINGKTKTTTVTTPSNNKPWTLSWSSDEISDGTYTNIIVTANDGNGGTDSKTYTGSIIVDKTVPTTPVPVATVDSSTKITVEASPKDLDSGVNSILWNKDGTDLDSWVTENILKDNNLTPNKKYTYKYKAIDNVDNISEYSEAISKHTLALYPTQIKLSDYTSTTVTLEISNNEDNENIPENKITLKEKDTDIIIPISEWSKDETITLTGLKEGKSYEIYLNTRNEDKVENVEVKLPSSEFNIKLVDSEGNEIDEILTNKSPELDIISEIEGEIFSENEDFNQILVKATVEDKDIGDHLKIKYSLSKDGHDVEGYKEIQLGEDIISDGSLQDFEESIEITSSFPEGQLELNIWVEDNRGGKSEVETYNIAVDKISPTNPDPVVTVDSEFQITIEALPSDELAGLHQEYILWNKGNIDLDSWTDVNLLIDDNLTSNQKYSYKYKVKDAVDNISEYSNEISKYTLAMNPIKVMLNDYTSSQAMFTIFNSEENGNVPETRIIIRGKDTEEIVMMSEWSEDEEKVINGLEENKQYEIYINTRNGDNVENGEIKLYSTSEPQLVDHNDNPIDDFIASDEEAAPIITIEPYNTDPTNQDIVVDATTDKGILNKSSHTFSENGSFTFIAETLLGNITEYIVTIDNIDKTFPIITIEEYELEPTNQDITVYASTDKGELNESSHIFSENGSFTFIAKTLAGNISEKTVTITNIDSSLPTEGEIIIIAMDEDGRTLQTVEKKNLGFGVQVIQAPVISGYKLTSTPVVTIWLKPTDSMKKVKFIYKLDKEWKGWEDADKVVEDAEKAVEEAEKTPSKETKDEAQKGLDKAKDLVDKLPESEKKDELNKKLDELQDRLDKIKIPNYDSKDKGEVTVNDKNENKEKDKTIIPEINNIPLDKFVARWEGHEVLSDEPVLVKKSKVSFEIDKVEMNSLNNKGLTPRIYQWNEDKEKWVALSTKIDKNKIETYKEVEGYISIFAVKQPEFEDVRGTEWYVQIADRANGLALVEGYTLDNGDTVLQPGSTITRSEFYTMTSRLFGGAKDGDNSLYNILSIKSIDESIKILDETNYTSNNWAKPYIASLYEKEIIRELPGYEDLNDNITRIEAMDILSKLLKEVEDIEIANLNEFKDSKEVKMYEELLKDNIEIADIIKGYSDKTLRPNNNMTRVEALVLIINSLEKLGW